MDEGDFTIRTLGDMYKPQLPREMNVILHTLNPCFSSKKGELHGLLYFLQKLGHLVMHNLNIKYGRLTMEQILYVI